MPLVKRTPAPAAHQEAPPQDIEEGLRSPEPGRRRQAAHACASRPDAIPLLSDSLRVETEPAVRQAILTALVGIGGDDAVRAIVPCLRSDDAGIRTGALDALRALSADIEPWLPSLLADPDADVRVLSTELARGMPADRATLHLCRMLERESHPNACAAALDVLAEVGTREAVPALRRLAARFAGEPFVVFAASVAIARIEGTKG